MIFLFAKSNICSCLGLFPEWTNPDFFHLDTVLFLNTASRNACVGLQLGPEESRGIWPGARPVPAIQMDCQCSGEKQPQNFKQIVLNGNKLFLPSCVMIWIMLWLCVSGGQREGKGKGRQRWSSVCVTCSPVDALRSLIGWTVMFLSLEYFLGPRQSFC